MSSSAHTPDRTPADPASLAASWGLVLAVGVFMAALGVVMLAWPGVTLTVLAIMFAIALFGTGIHHIVAVFAPGVGAGTRVLDAVMGALSILAGLLCLRSPLRTLIVLGLLIGAWWVVTGVIEAVAALSDRSQPGRWWRLVGALLSIAAGAFVLLQPAISLLVLKLVLACWLIVYGALTVGGGVALRVGKGRAAPAGEMRPSGGPVPA